MIIDNKQFRNALYVRSTSATSNSFIIKLDLSLAHTFTFNLLPHNWRLLVNSAGQSFQPEQ